MKELAWSLAVDLRRELGLERMAVAETAQRAQRRGEAREKAWDSEAAPLRRPGRVARWRRVAWLHSASLVLLVALRDTAAGGEPDDWPIFEKVRRRMPGCLGTRVSVCPCARVPACPCARVPVDRVLVCSCVRVFVWSCARVLC